MLSGANKQRAATGAADEAVDMAVGSGAEIAKGRSAFKRQYAAQLAEVAAEVAADKAAEVAD